MSPNLLGKMAYPLFKTNYIMNYLKLAQKIKTANREEL